MLSEAKNRLLTQVGPGTPMGDYLRRYWFPIAATAEFDDKDVKPIRLMGEDLTLYKDLSGTFGLVDRHCPHRRADLSYGYVEKTGIRCNYHGWLMDETGACIEQPYEDTANPNNKLKERCSIKAYPVRDMRGLLWTYMGPQPAPELPVYEAFTWDNGFVEVVTAPNPVQLVPVPGKLDRSGAFRMDARQLEHTAEGRDGPLCADAPEGRVR